MDNRIRQNEICIVSLPSCGYVFSSSPSCFIAYGFERSTLEMEIIRALLSERRIETYEADGALAPGQQVFCQKICSKIIQSQFCIVLLNNETVGKSKTQKTNANVHMEYGLMLGFNKYILPFQHEDYNLAFNVAGLDTVKYNNTFKSKAAIAIDQAISQTTQRTPMKIPVSTDLDSYLLLNGAIVSSIEDRGNKAIYELGAVCGFNLCNDFSGNRYIYFGNYPKLHPSVISWRVKKLVEILEKRLAGVEFRIEKGITTQQQKELFVELYRTMEIWILVNNAEDRGMVLKLLEECPVATNVFTINDITEEISNSEML